MKHVNQRLIRFTLAALSLFHTSSALAVMCTAESWDDGLCNLQIAHGERCANFANFRTACNNQTPGCDGRCVGFTPPGHWYPLLEEGVNQPRWRCVCGCVGERTRFTTSRGPLTAAQIIASRGNGVSVASLDDLDSMTLSYRPIGSVVHAPETTAIKIVLASGTVLLFSDAHPVVLIDESGRLAQMKKASELLPGDPLSNAGRVDEVVAISQVPYEGHMMNFSVTSPDPTNRIIVADGVLTGDHGWQETLHQHGSRQWFRHDILQAIRAYNARTGDN